MTNSEDMLMYRLALVHALGVAGAHDAAAVFRAIVALDDVAALVQLAREREPRVLIYFARYGYTQEVKSKGSRSRGWP